MVAELYVDAFYEIQNNYITKHMCRDCTCSPQINMAAYQSRIKEFEQLDTKTGKAGKYFDDCYLSEVEDGIVRPL